jgi:tRNA(fMet)-specific endonuclease VapC
MMFDTNFLIALQKERRLPLKKRPAHDFLREHDGEALRICTVVRGEFLEGRTAANAPWVDGVLQNLDSCAIDDETASVYARITRHLRSHGRLIGANDLWIAASAIRHKETLVSRNEAELKRVPELRLAAY